MRYFVSLDGREVAVDVTDRPGGGHDVRVLGDDGTARSVDADLVARGSVRSLRVEGRMYDLALDRVLPEVDVYAGGRRGSARVESERQRAAGSVGAKAGGAGDGVLLSPMPGKVVKVLVKEGDAVEAGAPLAVVEAMKMENELSSSRAGTVEKVFVQAGDAVEGGAKLVWVK